MSVNNAVNKTINLNSCHRSTTMRSKANKAVHVVRINVFELANVKQLGSFNYFFFFKEKLASHRDIN